MDAIDSRTRLFGLFGHPVSHSLSPDMHNAAFRHLGYNGCYLAFDVLPERLGEALQGVRALQMGGVNLTIPHKEGAFPHLDEVSPLAELIGAVNTVVNEEGRLIGHNTDGEGFLRSLMEEGGEDPKGQEVLILGAGGAAKAVAMALALHGVKGLYIANRNVERAKELAASVARGAGVIAEARELSRDGLADAAKRSAILIHTSPVGMHPQVDVPPILDPELITPDHLVCDLIYNPAETVLLRRAKERGARTLGGLGMLLYQGVLAFEKWTRQEAPVAVMAQALREGLAKKK